MATEAPFINSIARSPSEDNYDNEEKPQTHAGVDEVSVVAQMNNYKTGRRYKRQYKNTPMPVRSSGRISNRKRSNTSKVQGPSVFAEGPPVRSERSGAFYNYNTSSCEIVLDLDNSVEIARGEENLPHMVEKEDSQEEGFQVEKAGEKTVVTSTSTMKNNSSIDHSPHHANNSEETFYRSWPSSMKNKQDLMNEYIATQNTILTTFNMDFDNRNQVHSTNDVTNPPSINYGTEVLEKENSQLENEYRTSLRTPINKRPKIKQSSNTPPNHQMETTKAEVSEADVPSIRNLPKRDSSKSNDIANNIQEKQLINVQNSKQTAKKRKNCSGDETTDNRNTSHSSFSTLLGDSTHTMENGIQENPRESARQPDDQVQARLPSPNQWANEYRQPTPSAPQCRGLNTLNAATGPTSMSRDPKRTSNRLHNDEHSAEENVFPQTPQADLRRIHNRTSNTIPYQQSTQNDESPSNMFSNMAASPLQHTFERNPMRTSRMPSTYVPNMPDRVMPRFQQPRESNRGPENIPNRIFQNVPQESNRGHPSFMPDPMYCHQYNRETEHPNNQDFMFRPNFESYRVQRPIGNFGRNPIQEVTPLFENYRMQDPTEMPRMAYQAANQHMMEDHREIHVHQYHHFYIPRSAIPLLQMMNGGRDLEPGVLELQAFPEERGHARQITESIAGNYQAFPRRGNQLVYPFPFGHNPQF